MSVDLVQAVLEADITPTENKLAMLVLAEATNKDSGVAWPAMPLIARRMSVSVRTAQRVIKRLKANQLLLIVANEKGGRRSPVYRLLPGNFPRYPEPEAAARGDIAVSPLDGSSEATRGDIAVSPLNELRGDTAVTLRGDSSCHTNRNEPLIQAPPVDNSPRQRPATGGNTADQKKKAARPAAAHIDPSLPIAMKLELTRARARERAAASNVVPFKAGGA